MSLVKPRQLDAERALLACLLENPESYHDLTSPFTPEMFFGVDNALVYSTFIKLYIEGNIPDLILVKNVLVETDQYDVIGGDEYFDFLATVPHVESNLTEYAKLIIDAFTSRNVVNAGNLIRDAGYTKTAPEAVDVLFHETNKILEANTQGLESCPIAELMTDELVSFMQRLRNPGGDGIPTQFRDYDLLTGGIHTTDEIIIAARPSVGKTALMCRMMLNLAKQDIPVCMFSFEMSNKQLTQRLLAMESDVSLSKIRTGQVTEKEFNKVSAASEFIGALPIIINNSTTGTATEVAAITKKLIRTKGIKAAFVDYIQLMSYRVEYATQDLGGIVRLFKNLAISADITVVAASQLNRLVELRPSKIPVLSDLRQSGNIEEHADQVLMLYREEMYDPTEENKGKANLLIRKNRNGPIGSLPLAWVSSSVDYRNPIFG